MKPKDQEIYRKEFDKILQQFLKDSINRKLAESSWKKTYQGMKDKLERMDEELQLYARDLSARYKSRLEDRKTKKVYREDKGEDYSQEDVDDKIESYKQRQTKLLDELKKPQMNPSLTFQDQLNFEHTLEQCNLEVSFFCEMSQDGKASELSSSDTGWRRNILSSLYHYAGISFLGRGEAVGLSYVYRRGIYIIFDFLEGAVLLL